MVGNFVVISQAKATCDNRMMCSQIDCDCMSIEQVSSQKNEA